MVAVSVPSTADGDFAALRARVEEIDRRSRGSAALAQRARGVRQVVRRTTGMYGLTGANTFYAVAEVSTVTEPDRLYRVAARVPVNNMGDLATTKTLMSGRSFYTLDGSAPDTSSIALEWTNVYLEGGGLTHWLIFDEFLDTQGHEVPESLRVIFYVVPYNNGSEYRVQADDNGGNARFWVEDVGPGAAGRPIEYVDPVIPDPAP